MGTIELLRYLEKLEIGLSSFSYEELSTDEAGELKKTFNQFKNGLEDKVFGVHPTDQLEVIYEEIGISGPKKDESIGYKTILEKVNHLLGKFDTNGLTKSQEDILTEMRQLMDLDVLPGDFKFVEKNLGSKNTDKIDLKPLWDECMQQMDLMDELVRLFKQNILEFVGKTKINLQSKNLRGLDFSCEKIAPSLRMMHCHTLLEITGQMANVCQKDMDLKHLNFLYNQFLEEYPKVDNLLRKEMRVLKKV